MLGGIVYVHSKDWPKYVTFIKTVKKNRYGVDEYYVTNKENKLKFEDGKMHSPSATV